MCGIAGIVDIRSRSSINRALLEDMNITQFHRGPDEGGIHIEPGVGLGHRRLSIIDLSTGQQPLFNEDGTVVVVYNGEIYNFLDIRKTLQAHGHIFRSNCDTEVIVHAWEQWGEDCVTHFRGMFAFAIWDRNRQQLFLARDRLGIKPLYYAELPDGHVIFGSELKVLLHHPGFPRSVDPCAVEDYFAYGYIPDPRTIFKHAAKLSPGCTLTIRHGQPVPPQHRYWDIPFSPLLSISEAEASEELIHRLRGAVQSHLVSEVPLGAFLSGGIDSSAIVAIMAKLTGNPINTCSISFDDPKHDESSFANAVAEQYKTRHHVRQVKVDDFDLIDRLVSTYDEPFADDSALATYRLCQLAREHVTVALSGDGGDENFAGYEVHLAHWHKERIRSRLPGWLRRPLFGTLGYLYPKADWAPRIFRAKATFETLAMDSVESFARSAMFTTEAARQQLFAPGLLRELQGYRAVEVLRQHARNTPSDHPLSFAQYLTMKVYLPADVLTKVDRASMAHSLEVRVPLLDHEFVEWVSRLPPDYKLRGTTGKFIFKRALRDYLPDNILQRRKKGFDVPVASWLRGPLRERLHAMTSSSALLDSGMFNQDHLQKLVDQHQSGLRDNGAVLWSLLVFDVFCRNMSSGTDGVFTHA